MKKTIAIAALVAASFAVPVVPVQAASTYPDNCLVLPLLKADCRAAIRERLNDASTRTAGKIHWQLPVIGDCERAPAGSGHLYDC